MQLGPSPGSGDRASGQVVAEEAVLHCVAERPTEAEVYIPGALGGQPPFPISPAALLEVAVASSNLALCKLLQSDSANSRPQVALDADAPAVQGVSSNLPAQVKTAEPSSEILGDR